MASTRTATYSGDLSKPLDRVRFELGDVNCATAYLSDDEIEELLLQENGDPLRSAARGAKAIAARVAGQIDFSQGKISKSASQRFEHYNDLADDLERRASTNNALPSLGPTPDEKRSADQDLSRTQMTFKRGMTDNPRAGITPESDDQGGVV